MKKIVKALSIALIAGVFFASCGSTSKVDGADSGKKTEKTEKKTEKKKSTKKVKFDQAAFNEAYLKGDYSTCLAMLETRKVDVVLNDFDASMLSFCDGQYRESAKSFLTAQNDMQQVSSGMTAGKALEAAVLGENSVTYYGPAYERLLTYSMNVVNALKENDIDNAVGTFSNYTGTYAEEIAQLVEMEKEVAKASADSMNDPKFTAAANILSNSLGTPIDMNKITSNLPNGSSAVYSESPFLFYLGALTYAANGDKDHAADMEKHLRSAGVNADVSKNLNVVILSDKIAQRVEGRVNIPFGYIGDLPFNINPVFPTVESKNAVGVKKVSISDGQSSGAIAIEDFDKAVAMDVASRAKGAFYRSVFRSIVKKAPVVVAGVATIDAAKGQIAQATNPLAQKAATIALAKGVEILANNIDAIDKLEKADVRQGAFFPSKAFAANFNVAPGTYTVTVEYTNGKVDVIPDVVVSAGKPTVVVSECLNANNTFTPDAK